MRKDAWPVEFGFRPPFIDDEFGDYTDEDQWNTDQRNFGFIMEALVRRDLKPRRMNTGLRCAWLLDFGMLSENPVKLSNCKRVFGGLEQLQLSLHSERYDWSLEDMSEEGGEPFMDVLGTASALKTLHINTTCLDLACRVLSKGAFPRLKHLSLEDGRFYLNNLLGTVRGLVQRYTSLEKMDLTCVRFFDPGELIGGVVMENAKQHCDFKGDPDSWDADFEYEYGYVTNANHVGKTLKELFGVPGDYDGHSYVSDDVV